MIKSFRKNGKNTTKIIECLGNIEEVKKKAKGEDPVVWAKKYIAEVNIIENIEPFLDKIDFVDKVKTANFMTEASFISNCKRIILGVGPVTAHEVNEHISKNSYKKLVNQYQDLINKICN